MNGTKRYATGTNGLGTNEKTGETGMKNIENFFENIPTFKQFKKIHEIENAGNFHSVFDNVFDVYLYNEKKGKLELRPNDRWLAYYSNPVFHGDDYIDYIRVNGERLAYIDTFQDKLSAAYAISIYKDLITHEEFADRMDIFNLGAGEKEIFIYTNLERGVQEIAGSAIQNKDTGRWNARFLDHNHYRVEIGRNRGTGLGNEGGYSNLQFAAVALIARWVLYCKGMPLHAEIIQYGEVIT